MYLSDLVDILSLIIEGEANYTYKLDEYFQGMYLSDLVDILSLII